MIGKFHKVGKVNYFNRDFHEMMSQIPLMRKKSLLGAITKAKESMVLVEDVSPDSIGVVDKDIERALVLYCHLSEDVVTSDKRALAPLGGGGIGRHYMYSVGDSKYVVCIRDISEQF